MARLLRILGAVFLLIGVVGFLFAAVGLVASTEGPQVQATSGDDNSTVTMELPPDDPVVQKRRKMVETVLGFSLLVGGVGMVFLIAGFAAARRERWRGARPVSVSEHTGDAGSADR